MRMPMRWPYRALLIATFALAAGACGRVTSDDDASELPRDGGASSGDASNERTFSSFDATPFDAPTLRIDASISDCGEYLANREVLEQFGAAHAVGVYTVLQTDEECSGLGGTHVTMELQAACVMNTAPKLVHWGGHGCHTARAFRKGDVHVVAFEPADLPDPTPGWCTDALPKSTAKARWIDSVSSVEEGRDVLRSFNCPLPLGGP